MIIFDSGVAAAIALGADAVAVGRTLGLGLAADSEYSARRVLEILRREFCTTLGHLGCSSVTDLAPDVRTDL